MEKNLYQNQNFSSFRPIFEFELDGKRPRAELKIFQLELWLEPAWLGLITSVQYILIIQQTCRGKTPHRNTYIQ